MIHRRKKHITFLALLLEPAPFFALHFELPGNWIRKIHLASTKGLSTNNSIYIYIYIYHLHAYIYTHI